METRPLVAHPWRPRPSRHSVYIRRVWTIAYPFFVAFYVVTIVVLSLSGVRATRGRVSFLPDPSPEPQDRNPISLQEAYQALHCHTQQQTATLLSLSPAGLLGADQVYAGNVMLGLGKLLVGIAAMLTWIGFWVIDKERYPLWAMDLLSLTGALTVLWLSWGGLDAVMFMSMSSSATPLEHLYTPSSGQSSRTHASHRFCGSFERRFKIVTGLKKPQWRPTDAFLNDRNPYHSFVMAFSNHNERHWTVGVWFILMTARQSNLQVRNIGYLIWLVIFRGRVNNTPKSVQVPLYSWVLRLFFELPAKALRLSTTGRGAWEWSWSSERDVAREMLWEESSVFFSPSLLAVSIMM
ncbi:hypothetical protein NEUTE1DRAFT_131134 [Neurospora tetrasperma FGSC 2508]|uniref:Uncharacterized protein n=1 Tax=Neurospora tetrasperma (strain FGSC 2508 / ATCC MYA-4615 / P0657) TaxID=510951 RepID=F8MTM5_NEUT8|nr:uncharacterized protein NEUTE1DRAFT_131134 [Neurospora tetrasperma FGSC 2508]EGO55357.1 hypothetical protein NEUTE1DRAFT_131134 [Neurospora tetrasperma FGSC 2508]EGZ69417.1 hypothetical protein NEUTE2DRAFT_159892 [Neurospora tetrasperma FGSC 2509]